MKTRLLIFSLLLVCSSAVAAQSWRMDRARLCFARYEDNGAINILQSWIHIANYEIPIIGGQAVCLYVEPGSNELVVTSTIPYRWDSKNAEACKSRKLKLEVTEGESRTFIIEPTTKGATYTCGWRIEEASTSKKKPH